jgi:hypothetical protein
MRYNLSALAAALLLLCPGKAGAEPGTVLRVADAHPCGEVVSTDAGWQCQPAPDGGTLPPGWWVSQPQMTKLGGKLTEKDNEIAALRATNGTLVNDLQTCHDTPCPTEPPPAAGGGNGLLVFLIGIACGMGAAVAVVYMVTR